MCMKKTASALSCMLSATAGLWAVATESSSDEFSASVSFETWIQPAKGDAGRLFDKLTAGQRDGFLIDCWPNQSLRVIVGPRQDDFPDALQADAWQHIAVAMGTRGQVTV